MNFLKRFIEFIRYGRKRDGLIDVTDDKNFGSRSVYKPNKEDLEAALKQTFIVFNPKKLDQKDSDFCFPAGTKVLTENFKYENIENFNGGEIVYTHLGNKQKVLEVSKRKWQGTMCQIKVWNDYRSINCTKEHNFLVNRNGENKFIPAKEIKKDDYLVIPKIKDYKDTSIYSFEKDPDFLWVLGLYLAEGNVNCKDRIQFSLNSSEEKFAIKVKETLEKYGAKVKYYIKPEYSRCTVYVYGKKWVKLFKELCGEYCNKKRIGERLMMINSDLQLNIINGLIDGDGHIKKETRETILVSTSLKLLEQTRNILIRNELLASLNKRKNVDGKLSVWTLSYSDTENHRSYKIDENNIYVKVKEVICNEKEYYTGGHVYNLKVENDESYIVNNYAVHNCVGYGGAYEADATENFEGESEQGSGSYVFAGAKKWSGQSISSFGTSLLAGAMARVTYGICRKEFWDYKRGRRSYFANWNNIPQKAHDDAEKHKAGSAWQLDIPWGMSKFDAIVATLWHFKDKKVLIGTGNNAHRITVIGYDNLRNSLICSDTYGERTYEKGLRFINRDEARTLFTPYFVLDIERDLAELLVDYVGKTIKTSDSNDCYYVKDGAKHLFPSEKEAWSHNQLLAPYDGNKLVEVLDKKDFDKIPTGDPMKFEGGKNEFIIRRIAEKYKIKL